MLQGSEIPRGHAPMAATQQYLCRVRPARPTMRTDSPKALEAAVVAAPVPYLQQLVNEGVALSDGPTLNTDPSALGITV